MKIRDISETTSGGIAVVAQPVGKVIKRPNPSVFSKKKKTEGKSPHKKGSAKYKKHMAAMHAENKDEAIEEKATIPVKGYTDAYDLIHDFWFYGHNPSEMVSHSGPRSKPTWVGIEEPKHSRLNKFLDANGLSPSKLYNDELKVVLWLAKKMNISPMTVLRYGNDAIRFGTDTIKAVKQIVAKSKEAVEEASIGAPDYNPARGGYTDNMIGEPDDYYDAEQRQEAYDQLQDALTGGFEDDYIKDGTCPECAGSGYLDGDYEDEDGEENDECNGWGNYGCDEGEMQYADDTVSWKEIMNHDERTKQKAEIAKKPQPSDEILVGAMKQLHRNYVETGKFNAMELPSILRQMYPEISKQKAREIGGKFFHSFRNMNDEMSEDYNPRLVSMLARFEDDCEEYSYYGDTDMVTVDQLLKQGKKEDAAEEMAGAMSDQDGGSDNFDHIYDMALDAVEDYMHEPAMAEMRKLAGLPEKEVTERTYKDVGTADMVKDRRGKEFKFHKDAKQFKSVDGEIAGLDTKLGKDLLRIRRNQMKRTTPSYPGNK
jgi:hypothetical protein